jgi:hypothetical protein
MSGIILCNYRITGSATIFAPIGEYDPGTVLNCTFATEAVSGAPATISVTPSFQIAPLVHTGLNINSETSGLLKPYTTVSSSGDVFKVCLPDGDWKTLSNAAGGEKDFRRLIVPSFYTIARIQITVAFDGGSAPYVNVYFAVCPSN